MEPPRVQYATTSDGVSIAWAAAGQGPALLKCPTAPFSHVQEGSAMLGAMMDALTPSFRVFLFDARGTGMSERDVVGVSAETLLLDAQAVIDSAMLDRFIVQALGGSMLSTSTCLRLATEFPESVTHVVLESPCQNMREIADTPFGRVNQALAELDWSVYTQTLFRVLLGLDTTLSAGIEAYAAAAGRWVDPSVGVQYVREWGRVDVSDLLPRVRQPTLVLRNDPHIVPARLSQRVAARIPGAQFVQYSDPTYVHQAELIRKFVGASSPPTVAAPAAAGLVTILFTDMEGSTTLTQKLGDARAQEVLRTHNTIVRDALKAHSGSETKHTGDGIMASFASPSGALECAIEIQRGFAQHNESNPDVPIRVRIGLNAGEPVAEDEDLFGTAVQLAARICAHAEPGQVLLPEGVRHLVAGKRFLFADIGDTALRGFEDPVRLYELRWREDA